MKKNKLKNIAGLTLIEMLIGVVISSIMMAAIYTTYTVVNNSYGQVTERAKISRSGRDIVEMMMRDIRMAGFKYILGTNTLDLPNRSYLQFVGGDTSILESHDPIIIEKGNDTLGTLGGTAERIVEENHPDEGSKCCDRIHIVYDDFNQNDATQPYKRYKVSYYDLARSDGGEIRYAIYKSKIELQQARDSEAGDWPSDGKWVTYPDCAECYHNQLVRDYVDDMEFIPIGKEGERIPYPNPTTIEGRKSLYDLRAVDIRIAFKSKKDFFRSLNPNRNLKGLSKDAVEFNDKKLRDNVVVTVYTRNIGEDVF